MALNKEALKQGLKALQKEMMMKTEPDYDYYADQLATLIEIFVKSGTVTVAAGISVTTAGSATAQTGATTSTGTGVIS